MHRRKQLMLHSSMLYDFNLYVSYIVTFADILQGESRQSKRLGPLLRQRSQRQTLQLYLFRRQGSSASFKDNDGRRQSCAFEVQRPSGQVRFHDQSARRIQQPSDEGKLKVLLRLRNSNWSMILARSCCNFYGLVCYADEGWETCNELLC